MEYTYPSSFHRATTTARISSGIKFLVTNFVLLLFNILGFARERAKVEMAREAYIQWPHRRTMIVAVLLIVLSCVSISMATGICVGRFVEKIGAAPAAVIVRRGRPTG